MSQSHIFTWQLSMELEAPFNTGGIENATFGIDQTLLRNHEGKLIISGSQIRGLFLHYLKETGAGNHVLDWFGKPQKQISRQKLPDDEQGDERDAHYYELAGKGQEPQALEAAEGRGRLKIADLVIESPKEERGQINRIRVERELGSVKHGAILVIEQPFAIGVKVSFSGMVRLCGSARASGKFETLFKRFLVALPAIGANKSSGFGRVVKAELEEKDKRAFFASNTDRKMDVPGNGQEAIELTLCFDEPFMVDPSHYSGNLFRSNSEIPGAVIKGAIAEYLGLAKKTNEFASLLSRTTIRHAFPLTVGDIDQPRHRHRPFSLVEVKGDGLRDSFSIENRQEHTIIFETDWKGEVFERAGELYPKAEPFYVTRTRTAIEFDKLNAYEGRLFNYQSVSPVGHVWKFEMVPPKDVGNDDRQKFIDLVKLLSLGRVPVGRTQAEMKMGHVEEGKRQACRDGQGNWRIEVQTLAWLLGHEALKKLKEGASLGEVYRDYFKEIARHAGVKDQIDWEKFDFLSLEQWSGGFRAWRYKYAKNELGYFPYLLTQPGSVFVLKPKNGEDNGALQSFFEELNLYGLPPVGDMDNGDIATRWKRYPLLPENGYGEVRIDAEQKVKE